jgi:hypothetical protein
VNARSVNIAGLTSGAPPRAASCRWYSVKMASSTAARPKHTQVHAGQPCSRPWISGSRTATRAAVIISTPGMSSFGRPGALDSGTMRGTRISATAATGRLIRKQVRQSHPKMSALISSPPISWPNTAAMPIVNP